ncbi:MAG TPA: aldo/keto reductase [Gemmatimonadales bacterium]|nr:aldo/keto reductase [Gemmatimonadales bacterium]
MRTVTLPSGEEVPVLGQGTWRMGESSARRKLEIAALRSGLDLGLSVIDTAEMYADGGAEKVVGEAILGRRDKVFLVSKVLPQHATKAGTIKACERSLARLRTDRLDLYLLHWPSNIALDETLSGFASLVAAGKIRYWGVSNFDLRDMEELMSLRDGHAVATDQVLYNLGRRGIERDLLPWCAERHVPLMAYSPIEQGRMLKRSELKEVAARRGATPAQVALAWVLHREGILAIPKMGSVEHVEENHGALKLSLTSAELDQLEAAFPLPAEKVGLEVL